MWQKFWDLLDRGLFGPHTEGSLPLARLLRLLRYPYALLRDLFDGELTLRATGLVYTTLFALIPLLALSFAVLKAFGAHRELEPFLLEFFRPVGDAGPRLVQRLMEFAERVRGGLVGVVGFTLLLWTLVGTVKKIEDSMNFVWRVQRARSVPRRVVEFLALVTFGPLVIAAVFAFWKLALDSVASHTPQDFAAGAKAVQLLIWLAPHLIFTGLFAAIYMLMPNTRVRLLPALGGALAAGVLWATVGKAFAGMVLYTSRLTLVYAGFAIVVAIFLWTYLGWLVLLLGAQLAFYLQNPNYLRLGHRPLHLAGSEQERLALDIMARVGASHHAGDPPWTVDQLARQLALPGSAVADLAAQLERSGLLAQADDCKLFPGREISGITLAEIVDSVRARRTGHEPPPRLSAPGVLDLQREMEQAWRGVLGTRTLADFVSDEARPPLPR
jgi:membrane protein